MHPREVHTSWCAIPQEQVEQQYMLNPLADTAIEGHQVQEYMGSTETTLTLVTTSKCENTGDSDNPETSTGGFTEQQQGDVNMLFAHKNSH